jgi:hypothetical protein
MINTDCVKLKNHDNLHFHVTTSPRWYVWDHINIQVRNHVYSKVRFKVWDEM